MTLLAHRYGKGRVRTMRVHREGERNEVRETALDVMLHGDFGRAYTDADNASVVATDTIKNIVNIVAREQIRAHNEDFADAVARRFLDRYPHVTRVEIISHETRWTRLNDHPHSFVRDANGTPIVLLDHMRDAKPVLKSGVRGFTFLKSTRSGFEGFPRCDATTLPETADRIAATSMDATWLWAASPEEGYARANASILDALLGDFADTYSASLQDSLYRMATAALAATAGITEITLACPNKHYLPINLAPFGASADNLVFTPSDEPHGQIECTVGR
jgi:urate oxidase